MAGHELRDLSLKTATIRPILIFITKILISALLIYQGWYIEKYGPVQNLLQVFAVLIIFFTLLCAFGKPRSHKNINSVGIWWTCFGIVAIIVGQFTRYAGVVNDALTTYFSFLAICYCVGSIAQYGNNNWLAWTMIAVSLLSAFSATFSGYNYVNGGYAGITMGPNNNPNNLGMVMSIGVFYLLMPNRKQSMWMWAVRIFLVGVYLNVIVNTGSRSGVLCLGTMVGLSVFFNYKYLRGSEASKLLKRVFLGVACVGAVFFALHFIQGIGSGTSGINRLLDNFNSKSFGGRTSLYLIAFKIFQKAPVFGVGYNGFSVVSNLNYYSHSTYMELLSCTGVVGFLLFQIPIVKGIWNSFKYRTLDRGRSFTLLMLFVVVGFFGILFYYIISMILVYYAIISMNMKIAEQADDKNDRD